MEVRISIEDVGLTCRIFAGRGPAVLGNDAVRCTLQVVDRGAFVQYAHVTFEFERKEHAVQAFTALARSIDEIDMTGPYDVDDDDGEIPMVREGTFDRRRGEVAAR